MDKLFHYLTLLLIFIAGCADKQPEKQNIAEPTEPQQKVRVYEGYSDVQSLDSLSGTLNYTGAEPFARPAIFVSGEMAIPLRADSLFINHTFPELNGEEVTLFGTTDTSASQPHFVVEYYRLSR